MYRAKICKQLLMTYELVPDARPKNRDILESYLYDACFQKIDMILRGQTFPIYGGEPDPVLVSKIQPYLDAEEARMSNNLEALNYNLDSVADVNSVTGPGRIEKVSPIILPISRCITCPAVPISVAILAGQA